VNDIVNTAPRIDRAALVEVLGESLYPGAARQSIEMVLGYCEAAGLDPLLKPVHIATMRVEDKNTGQWVRRDVVLPGIGLYRIQANRTGQYAGQDEPVFGPDIQVNLGGNEMTIPEYCQVTVYRLVGGARVPFPGRAYWLETYATAGAGSSAPNTMWRKRPRGQIEKCAEALALRKGFPELGAQPTAEEIGEFEGGGEAQTFAPIKTPAPMADVVDATPAPPRQPSQTEAPEKPPAKPAGLIGEGELKWVSRKREAIGMSDGDWATILAFHGIQSIEKATTEQFASLRSELTKL